MTAPPMIERMAKAIYESDPCLYWSGTLGEPEIALPWRDSRLGGYVVLQALGCARAALVAMRAPSTKMKSWGAARLVGTPGAHDIAHDVYCTMIDAALADSDAKSCISEEQRYAALGRACEANGLGWYAEGGEMLFQQPADHAVEIATEPMLRALRPFAAMVGEGDEDFPDSTKVVAQFGRTTDHSLTLGHLRAAAEIIRKVDQ